MKILFIGDVVGELGRKAVALHMPILREQYKPDFTIINCENVAGGVGVTEAVAEQLFNSGADVLTSGNHFWDKKGIEDYAAKQPKILRPANYPSSPNFPCPGRGYYVASLADKKKIAVINLQGRVFMPPLDCPFQKADEIIPLIQRETNIIILDFHAEATSEKKALALYLNGRVSAVIGTHTHVQTADEQILSSGTAFLTDVGMTGPNDSVIGVEPKQVIQKLLTLRPCKYTVAKNDLILNGCVFEVDPVTGKAKSIKRINTKVES